MNVILKIILVCSVLLNLLAVWGFFHYIKYGGSPLGELKRKLTGSTHQETPQIPYTEDNARIIKEIEDGTADPDRVVFFGASITRRWDLEKYFPNTNMINRGVGNQLVPSMLARYKRDVLDLQPKAVIIKFCSINIRPHMPLQKLKDGMTMMVDMAQSKGITPIVSTIIPAGKPEAHIGDFDVAGTLNEFNDWVRQYTKDNSLNIIDFAEAIGNEDGYLPRDCSTDPVHVNDKGYLILSNAARPVIEHVLGRQ